MDMWGPVEGQIADGPHSHVVLPPAAPVFIDDTGGSVSWIPDEAINPITVPAASGSPAPAYAVVGNLPAGIFFNAGTRIIDGTPTVLGTGRITIEATNSEGSDTWTIDYTVEPETSERSIYTLLPAAAAQAAPNFADDTGDAQSWTQNQAITSFTVPAATGSPTPTYAAVGSLPAGIDFDIASRVISGTPTAVGSGTIAIRATNSLGSDDWTATYTTIAPVAARAIYTLEPTMGMTAPAFADSTGDAQSWTQNTAIASITVPAATGTPTPTYVATGVPAGINFNTTTRVISGTPTATGSGTITVTATNSEGSATWTVTYATAAALTAPAFFDDTGNAQSWTVGTAITAITVPAATGAPTPRYSVKGTLPAGIAFDTNTRIISGAPTAVASGTITIEASNSEGIADWTVDYATTAAVSTRSIYILEPTAIAMTVPVFADDTGDAQGWTQDQAITSITVPAATGNPTPTYAVVGSLPTGISFSAASRIISGTPTATGSGTITIRATNNQGSDNWTVGYTTSAAAAPDLTVDTPTINPGGQLTPSQSFTLATVVRNVGAGNSVATTLRWRRSTNSIITTSDPEVGTDGVRALAANGTSTESISLTALATPGTYYYGATVDSVINESDVTNNASGAVTVVVVASLTAPVFSDDTGNAQGWTQNQAITPLTVPAATGNPAPAYAAVGTLPAGIVFDTGTRRISGTPTGTGSGTIRIRATNSQGTDDWTVTYSISTVTPGNRSIYTLLPS